MAAPEPGSPAFNCRMPPPGAGRDTDLRCPGPAALKPDGESTLRHAVIHHIAGALSALALSMVVACAEAPAEKPAATVSAAPPMAAVPVAAASGPPPSEVRFGKF